MTSCEVFIDWRLKYRLINMPCLVYQERVNNESWVPVCELHRMPVNWVVVCDDVKILFLDDRLRLRGLAYVRPVLCGRVCSLKWCTIIASTVYIGMHCSGIPSLPSTIKCAWHQCLPPAWKAARLEQVLLQMFKSFSSIAIAYFVASACKVMACNLKLFMVRLLWCIFTSLKFKMLLLLWNCFVFHGYTSHNNH
jgi:hypothetical protein